MSFSGKVQNLTNSKSLNDFSDLYLPFNYVKIPRSLALINLKNANCIQIAPNRESEMRLNKMF